MKKLRFFKILLWKAYFDKGWSLSSYLKYAVALFAVRVPNVKIGVVVAGIYGIFCFIAGWWWFKLKLIETENEIQNIFNPFQREMREKINGFRSYSAKRKNRKV
jgi:hypothetical protein